MKKLQTLLLKTAIILIGLTLIAAMIWFPQTEGRAENLDLISIYFDPLIIYTYIATIPFLFGLYQAFKLLILIEKNQAFTQQAVDTLKNTKYASFSLVGLILIAIIYIRFFIKNEDPAGPTVLGISLILAFTIVAIATAVFQKLFQNAVDIKNENDLTV